MTSFRLRSASLIPSVPRRTNNEGITIMPELSNLKDEDVPESELFDLKVEDMPEADIDSADRRLQPSASFDCPTWR